MLLVMKYLISYVA